METEAEILSCTENYNTMKKLDSKYILKQLKILSEIDNNRLFIVMEYAPKGNLSTFIRTSKGLSAVKPKFFNVIDLLRTISYSSQIAVTLNSISSSI